MTEKRLLPVSGKQMVKVFGRIGYKIERQSHRNVKGRCYFGDP